VVALGEITDAAVETVRENEDAWLADLRGRLGPAQEKRRHTQRLLEEANAEEFYIYQLGRWVQTTADDGPMGRQPAPVSGPVPARFNRDLPQDALERPWHKAREWNSADKVVPA
jgi:hypothetical protein